MEPLPFIKSSTWHLAQPTELRPISGWDGEPLDMRNCCFWLFGTYGKIGVRVAILYLIRISCPNRSWSPRLMPICFHKADTWFNESQTAWQYWSHFLGVRRDRRCWLACSIQDFDFVLRLLVIRLRTIPILGPEHISFAEQLCLTVIDNVVWDTLMYIFVHWAWRLG